MSCWDTTPYTCSYDSGGGKDYSSLATWEADTDNDLAGYSGPVILDCYDSQNHNDSVDVAGAANTSNTKYRRIQSSASCAVPFAGKDGTGAKFSYTSSIANVVILTEYYSVILNCVVSGPSSTSSNIYAPGQYTKVINCLSTNGGVYCIFCEGAGQAVIYNCIAYESTNSGIIVSTLNQATAVRMAIACTSCSNGGYGVHHAYSTGKAVSFTCYAKDNTSGDFRETYADTPSGWNASKDTTADLAGVAPVYFKVGLDLTLDADYLPTSTTSLYGTGGTGNNWGRNPFNDISASYDLADFLKNDTDGWALSKKDIRGRDRPSPDTADSSWAVGAAEYFVPPPPSGSYRPVSCFLGI